MKLSCHFPSQLFLYKANRFIFQTNSGPEGRRPSSVSETKTQAQALPAAPPPTDLRTSDAAARAEAEGDIAARLVKLHATEDITVARMSREQKIRNFSLPLTATEADIRMEQEDGRQAMELFSFLDGEVDDPQMRAATERILSNVLPHYQFDPNNPKRWSVLLPLIRHANQLLK